MKNLIVFLVSFCLVFSLEAQTKQLIYSFPLSDVRLLESPFLKAQELDKQYLLELDADRLLAPFLREAGLTPKAESYTNWENTGLDGHIGGHYVSALSLMHAGTGDPAILDRLNYMLSELKRCQEANGNGYIGGVPGGKVIWEEIAAGNIRAGGFDLNGKWVPLYNIHKTYAGLRDAWLYTQNTDAKEMLIQLTEWAIRLVSQLSDEQMQDMLRSEHGGLNETFADVAAITGDRKYLELAHRFSHQVILQPLLQKEDKLTGMHANTQIPKVLGFKRIADLEGNGQWSEAARFFWETVVEHRSVAIGGNSVSEHFNPVNDFSRMVKSIEGPETCNTYNMLRLTKMLYETSAEKRYIDYYERALYNHILSTQHPESGGFVYFTQMRPGHYRVYSQPHTSFWCCVGSGLENHAKYGEMIYSHTDRDLYVNLFIPSRLNWQEKGIEVIQTNNFPDEPRTTLTMNTTTGEPFTLYIRYPHWVAEGAMKCFINKQPYQGIKKRAGYIAIERQWTNGDQVEIEMPMQLRSEQLPDGSNYYTFAYGPVILAAKTGTEDMQGLFADDSRGGHIAHGKQIPLKDMPILVSEPGKLLDNLSQVNGKPLTFRLTGLYPDTYSEGFELIPFNRLHESRYMIYWPQATKEDVVRLQKEIEQQEEDRVRLDVRTIDKVVCGEQQPESDHFIQSEHSYTGVVEDIHWREARGWFSYQLKNTDKQAHCLYLSYFNRDRNRHTDIYINDKKITTLELDGGNDDRLFKAIYWLPESEREKDIITVRIAAPTDAPTTQIAEIRLLIKMQ